MNLIDIQKSFFESALELDSHIFSNEQFNQWIEELRKTNSYEINKIPFSECDKWSFADDRSSLRHESGKFFSIEGLLIETNFGSLSKWSQPIINQPEIGILGFITKVIDGVRHFLVQAKMEPGNIDLVQISPTLQATKSNFTQVHKGKKPAYLEYFLNHPSSSIIYNQLQIEQCGRFIKKRNRNVIIEITDELSLEDYFKWLTLGQIKKLLQSNNIINMDSRTVISCISYMELIQSKMALPTIILNQAITPLTQAFIKSIHSVENSIHNEYQIISWFTDLKINYELKTTSISLTDLEDWAINEYEIKNIKHDYFKINAFRINGGAREVNSWCQPLITEEKTGAIGFLTTYINKVMHFLVQAKMEPGSIDTIDMCPTISVSNFSKENDNIPFVRELRNANDDEILIDSIQSEEGGRFYHVQNKYMIILKENYDHVSIPENYIWMTLGQILSFIKHGYFNIEARSLISCINLI